jgi:large subunit ribosomal protein L13
MTLGRMAARIAVLIRGKHKPIYEDRRYDLGDKVVVVNAGNPKVTGKKRQQKLYRHHTGYPSGLREYTMKEVLEKRPEEVVFRAVKGMIPNNRIRKQILEENLKIYAGPYHPHEAQRLPQFLPLFPEDLNL